MTSCSAEALSVGEPLVGSAPEAASWIVLEQPGPWGRQALLDSHLDPALGRRLTELSAGTGVTVVLARHPDRPERAREGRRNVWVSTAVGGAPRIRHGMIDDPADVATWDFDTLGRGLLPDVGSEADQPLLLVCTHSGRDRCCAVNGRGLVAGLLSRLEAPDRGSVWECSHLGGHRFSPTVLSLPVSAVYGRLGDGAAMRLLSLAAEGRLLVDHLRGRSTLAPPLQAAEIEVCRRTGLDTAADLETRLVSGGVSDDEATVEVRHADGRRWLVHLVRVPLPRPRPESCGKDPVPGHSWSCTDVA